MSRRRLKARDKITQKMSRDGLVQRNETQGEEIRISQREADFDIRGDTPETKTNIGKRQTEAVNQTVTEKSGSRKSRSAHERFIKNYEQPETHAQPKGEISPSLDAPREMPKQPEIQGDIFAALKSDIQPTEQSVNLRGVSQSIDGNAQFKTPENTVLRHESEAPVFNHEPSIQNTMLKHKSPSAATPNKKADVTAVNPRDPPKPINEKSKLQGRKDSALLHSQPEAAEIPVGLHEQVNTDSSLKYSDTLFQHEIRSGETPSIPKEPALRQTKPAVLQHQSQQTDNKLNVQSEHGDKLKTQKDSVLLHSQSAENVNLEQVGDTSDMPLNQSDATPDDRRKPQRQSGKGKQRVQGNAAYRQKKVIVPFVEPKKHEVILPQKPNETAQPFEDKPGSSVSANVPQPGDSDKPTPKKPQSDSAPKPTDTKPDSHLKTDKPGKLNFSEDEAIPNKSDGKPDRKLIKAERQAKRAGDKLEKAKDNLPAKKKLRSERVFDEQTGKARQKLHFEKEVKPQGENLKGALPLRPVKFAANTAIVKAHAKVYQLEHENVAVKASHKAELIAEGGVRTALRFRKTAPYRKVAKLEKKAAKKSTNLSYRKAVADNPKLKSNVFSRMWQKRKIRKDYAKKARDVKKAAGTAKKAATTTARVTRFMTRVILKNPKVLAIVGIIVLIILIFMSIFNFAASIGSSGFTAIIASTYLAETEDIENAALTFSEWETDLRLEILHAETNHPGFNEYRFNTGSIGHCPLQLMAYLTAVHHDFSFDDIQSYLQDLFAEQYTLTFTPSVEIRYTTDADGNPVPFDWHVMTVTLESRPFSQVLLDRMTPDQQAHYFVLLQTNGNRQIVGSPFDFNWQPFISSHYGWRVHPIDGVKSLHRGIDIALPEGTPIRATHNGVVTVSEYMGGFGNVVFIMGDDGIETRYAHCHTLLVNVGDTVTMGDVIATVGTTGASTGNHLHMEVLINGVHVNPAFHVYMGG